MEDNTQYPIIVGNWKIVSQNIIENTCDTSFFHQHGSSITRTVSYFFNMEDMQRGEHREITLNFENEEYSGRLECNANQGSFSIIWYTPLGNEFNRILAMNDVISFEKMRNDYYKVEIITKSKNVTNIREFNREVDSSRISDKWFPSNYNPDITVSDWVELLKDTTVFNYKSLQIMKRMKDYGGQATCKQLSMKYGENFNFYNAGSSSLARRVAKKTGCTVLKNDNDNTKWWPILFLGRDASANEEGAFIWKLRDELSKALDMVDLSEVLLYANPVSEEIKYTKKDFLRIVYMTEERYNLLESLLRNKMNIILQGAPGVGKTFAARKLAYAMMGEVDDSRIEMVQFHQNYSYEDFIMGYRPDGVGFKLTEGIFYRFCKKASSNPEKEYFFIIDEINRGNMSKILGELMMLIEKGYRGTELTLAYNGLPFSVPENLYIIGMMNTADRSLAMIDYALRRRFSFFEIEPGFNSEGFQNYQNALENETFNELINQIKILNKDISTDASLGRGFRIGHSYFCGQEKNECTREWMRSVVEFDILPMLEEYWFDEPDKIKYWENVLLGVFNDEG